MKYFWIMTILPLFIGVSLQPTSNVQAQTDKQAAIVKHVEQALSVVQVNQGNMDVLQPALGYGAIQ